eukprot:2343763-Lingulodinium_polyedra.AAC.1
MGHVAKLWRGRSPEGAVEGARKPQEQCQHHASTGRGVGRSAHRFRRPPRAARPPRGLPSV